ncbi:Uncharacterised protein [Enterobacter cloacae]|nr:Uncharacterised protein [Enterobacter cloacae]
MQVSLHTGHRVNLAAQTWDEEGVHYGVGGHFELNRSVRREGDFIHGSNALLWIDEEPFPVHGDHFNGNRFFIVNQRFARLKCVSGFPGQYSKEQDDQNRYRPDHSFHFIGV